MRERDSGLAVVGDLHLKAAGGEQLADSGCSVRVVLDDENPGQLLGDRARQRFVIIPRWLGDFPRERQPQRELAAQPGSRARGQHAAAVHLSKRLDQGQADSQPPLRAIKRLIHLSKRFEDSPQHFRRYADPVVADPDDCPVAISPGDDVNEAPVVGVLGGIGEQVDEDLFKGASDLRRRAACRSKSRGSKHAASH